MKMKNYQPPSGPDRRYAGDDSREKPWTVEQLQRLNCNPIYAGVGPYPQVIDDATWIRGGKRMIKEVGPERFLAMMLEELRFAWDSAIKAGLTKVDD